MNWSFILVTGASFLLLFQTPDIRLEQFQHEAEQEFHKPISITESDKIGINNGETSCDKNPVQIRIRKGLDPETREEVLAHELGHAYLCARGLVIITVTTPLAVEDGLANIVGPLGAAIGSCFIDPLVDAEIAKRGFKTDKMAEALLRKVSSHTRQDVHNSVARGDLYADLSAVGIYCSELRYPSLPVEKFENVFKDEPQVLTRLEALRRDLGNPTCSDTSSCIKIIERLRDEFELKRYVSVWNPETNNFE